MLKKIREVLLNFSKSDKAFLILTMFCGFFISCEYGITRSSSQSIFISIYTAKFLPYAWISIVPLNILVIYLYNKFLPQLGCLKTLKIFITFTIAVNTLCGLFVYRIPYLSFLHYVWKDIYILLMFKQLWSLIHSTINMKGAKYIYGLIFACGGLGSIIGGLLTSIFATKIGSNSLLFNTLILYSFVYLFYSKAFMRSPFKNNIGFVNQINSDEKVATKGFSLVFKSNYLLLIFFLIVFMEMSVAFVDYQFSYLLGKSINDTDLRTQFMGNVIMYINILTTIFQLIGGVVIINLIGLKNSHILIPIFLCLNSLLLVFFPIFGVAVYSYIIIKSTDFSIFSVSREMLYIPLSINEKYRAKAVIDVFGYRSSKAFASLFLILLQSIFLTKTFSIVSDISISVFFIWTLFAIYSFNKKDIYEILINS